MKYRYLILFPLACLEGPILAILCGYLVHRHILSLIPTILIFIAGDVIPDTVYYMIGRSVDATKLSKWAGRFLRVNDQRAERFRSIWTDHVGKTVFLGKLSYGLSIPVIISSGMARVPYKKFIGYAIPTTIFQYTVYLSVGYYVGYAATQFKSYITTIGLIIAAILVVALVFYVFIGRYAKKEIEEEVAEHEQS